MFVRLAAQHRKPAERAMPNERARLRAHGGDLFRQPGGYLLSPRVCRSAQYKVAAKTPKAAAMSATTRISTGIV
jgi:hypothetical protein